MLHHIFYENRSNHICKHGHCNAGAFPTNLYDGHNGRPKMAIGCRFSACIHFLSGWNKYIWSIGSSNWKVNKIHIMGEILMLKIRNI